MEAIAAFPQGLEAEGAKELLSLGATSVRIQKRSVAFKADMALFYRLHLRARLPFRLLREVARFRVNGPNGLYQAIQRAFDWELWLHPSMTFRVDVSGSSSGLTHSHFTALQVKNAVIDLQRHSTGNRSTIDLQNPDLCVHLHLHADVGVLSLDGSAGSLHKRGYRSAVGIAPMKENLASGLIRISGWDGNCPLVDPLCGSGTFLTEAVSSARFLAPGLGRSFLFEGWADFDLQLWNKELQCARNSQLPFKELPVIIGCESNFEIANQAKINIRAAGFANDIKIQMSHFRELKMPSQAGIILCNPPYGKRLNAHDDLNNLYHDLGSFLKQNASGWQLWLLSGNPLLTRSLRLKASQRIPVSNGGIDCRWLKYQIN